MADCARLASDQTKQQRLSCGLEDTLNAPHCRGLKAGWLRSPGQDCAAVLQTPLPRLCCCLQTPIVGLDLPDIAGLPPPVKVGNVYQRFSSVERGIVENIIEFSVPFLLEQDKGCTFTVEARCANNPMSSCHVQARSCGVHSMGLDHVSITAPVQLVLGSLQWRWTEGAACRVRLWCVPQEL
jgi:hypothetical protein